MKNLSWVVSLIAFFLLWNLIMSVAFRGTPAAVFGWGQKSPDRIVLRVNQGDSLADLTYRVNRRYGTRLSPLHLQRSNRIRNATVIRPGMKIAVPLVSLGEERRAAIAGGRAGIFRVSGGVALATRPIYEVPEFSEVKAYDSLIRRAAYRHRVDPDLVRAIVYMETTHGWYDAVTGLILPPRSLRPMNVNLTFWGEALGVNRKQLEDPRTNIDTGVRILRGIRDRLARPNIRAWATLYNNLSAERVNDYGARVETIYREKLWRK